MAALPPSSVSAANYYEMKPNPWYVSLGVKGYQQTADYPCAPAAVMSLSWFDAQYLRPGKITRNVYIVAVPQKLQ